MDFWTELLLFSLGATLLLWMGAYRESRRFERMYAQAYRRVSALETAISKERRARRIAMEELDNDALARVANRTEREILVREGAADELRNKIPRRPAT